ncbi:MAG: DUF4198 domain-containing protein [Novosphingobium sp.]
MFSRIALAVMALTSPALTQAHEILVLPGQAEAQTIPVTVLMTEDFIKPDRVPLLDAFTLERIEGESRAIVPVTAADKALQTSIASGPAVLLASLIRDRMEAPKAKDGEAAPPARMTRVADYAKSYVGQTADTRNWERPAGSRLEVMPLSNPAMLKVGDTLRVRVLFDGAPIETMVQATFDGNGRGWPVRLQSNTSGEASIPMTRAGHWIIRAKHQREETADTHVFYDGAANIVVNVME